MTPQDLGVLVHLLGFVAGVVLYAMLGAMTLRLPGRPRPPEERRSDRIPLATSVLGLVWNSGALVLYGGRDLGLLRPEPWLGAVAFSALGFLPAVVVHASLASRGWTRSGRLLAAASYALSAVAATQQILTALEQAAPPARGALLLLSVGYVVIVGILLMTRPHEPRSRKVLTAVALAAFAVMALHLSRHEVGTDTLLMELLGHHLSLPLAVVILYQDFRFALADLFLKRVLTLLALVALSLFLYTWLGAPLLEPYLARDPDRPRLVALLLALWILTALAYPVLRDWITRFVDRVVLRRTDYRQTVGRVSEAIDALATPAEVLDTVCAGVAETFSASHASWSEATEPPPRARRLATVPAAARGREATVWIPTADPPSFRVTVSQLNEGRRFLSDDLLVLEAVANLAGRRIDAVRVAEERYARDRREREILQLATEAELRALRAQLNPHFLFNTLTTIGHLIREAPDRALDTLLRLTGLLRAVLKRSDGGFVSLDEELQIVRSYLAIEHARFEERLQVSIDVPDELRDLDVPQLLLQPLVENAVKHGIAPLEAGGRVSIKARLEPAEAAGAGERVSISIVDTGAGATPAELAAGRRSGIGLASVARRLDRYYGDGARLDISSAPGVGTTVRVVLPAGPRGVAHARASSAAATA